MTATLSIAAREWASLFRTPTGWIVVALYLLLSGIAVTASAFEPGAPASLRAFFAGSQLVLLVVAPAVSMRMLADERRAGTLEPLMALPVSDWAIALGKYLGGIAFLLTMLAPTLLYVLTLEILSNPDYGPIAAGYLGLVLLGSLYIAVGLLASSLTESTVVALLATLFALLLLELAATRGAAYLGEPFDRVLYAASVRLRIADFAKGVIDTGHVVFFLAWSGWFVVLTAVTLEVRRWR